MNNSFDCCFEFESKGIYMDVELVENSNYISFSSCSGYETVNEVCLRKADVKDLISLLEEYINKID